MYTGSHKEYDLVVRAADYSVSRKVKSTSATEHLTTVHGMVNFQMVT